TWPSPLFAHAPRHPDGCHHPIALGLTAAAANLTTEQTALIATHGIVAGPASAAVRLLGLDPYQAQALLARLARACDQIATIAAADAGRAPADLPANTAPLADIHAETHATWEVRLFAS
ncbi:urease accessory UreF family protein, partial [Dactylosporangium sp. NPDC000555]|uniref:urease accessory protein UreF n=1 Tax=Dactylosporangium sp. NPDC000555 TaxID=3154260 RepID=UPI00332915DD